MFEENSEVRTTAIDDENKAILEKYGNDPNKLANAFKEIRSRASMLENTYRAPKEYIFEDSASYLDETSKRSLLDIAQEGQLTQKQFDSLVKKANATKQNSMGKAEQARQLREAALGGLDEVEKLRTFYADRLPASVLDRILTSGSPEEIHELKRERGRILDGGSVSALGDNKMDVFHSGKGLKEQYAETTQELRDTIAKKRRATPQEQIDLEAKSRELAIAAGKIKQAISEGLNKF